MTIALAKTVEYTASIANAAKWNIVLDAITTATSTTAQSATAQFTSSMVGMTCTVTGAGTNGTTLLTSFAAYISATQMTMADAAARTTAAATLSFGGRSEDPRHAEPEIIEAVLEADAEECREILNSPNNPRRGAFTETVTVLANGAQLPSRTGVLGKVEIEHADTTWRVGQVAPLFKILRWNGDPTTYSTTTNVTDGYYDISTGNLNYTGTSAKVSYVNFIKGTTPQAPDESQSNVVARALRILFLKEGDDVQAASLLNQIGMQGLGLAGRGEQDSPNLVDIGATSGVNG